MTTFPQQIIPVGLQMIFNTLDDKTESSMVARWMREYEIHSSRNRRKQQILDALRDGYDTVKEITSATKIPEASVRRMLDRLVKTKQVQSNITKNYKQIEYRYSLTD